jgi:hypothetical protein
VEGGEAASRDRCPLRKKSLASAMRITEGSKAEINRKEQSRNKLRTAYKNCKTANENRENKQLEKTNNTRGDSTE